MNKKELFESERPSKALAIMALPTIASQLVILIYNLADTWFIGRTNNPYMIGATSIALTVYLVFASISNIFGVGGGSLMVRRIGEKNNDEARKVASYSVFYAFIFGLAFSLIVFILMNPILKLLGASDNTLEYGRQYLLYTSVIGGVPTVLTMCMSQLLRNSGYSKEAGLGIGLGSVLNIILDPIFMFVIFPEGDEVIGAAVATCLSNVISMIYFLIMYVRVSKDTVLSIPTKPVKIGHENKASLYTVGLPAAVNIFLFDFVTIFINKIAVSYSDITLASMGIVLKLERIPINIGLGICLGMVPLIAYNYGAKNKERLREFFKIAVRAITIMSLICVAVFWIFSDKLVGLFIDDAETIRIGKEIIKGRCFILPFMMFGYAVVNYMNAINKGIISFILAIIRHLVLIIPIMLIMNKLWGMQGYIWSQVVADVLNALISFYFYKRINRQIDLEEGSSIL